MVKGRLKRESNPMPGEKAGFSPQHDSTGSGDFINTSPANPLPTKDDLVLAKLTQLETEIKATNTKLDGTINTQVTGSKVEDIKSEKIDFGGILAGQSKAVLIKPEKGKVLKVLRLEISIRASIYTPEEKMVLSIYSGNDIGSRNRLIDFRSSGIDTLPPRIDMSTSFLNYGIVDRFPQYLAGTNTLDKDLIEYISNIGISHDYPITVELSNEFTNARTLNLGYLIIVYKEIGGN